MAKNELYTAYIEVNATPEDGSIEQTVLMFADRMLNRMEQKKPSDAEIGVYHPVELIERMHKNIGQLLQSYRLGVQNPTAAVDIANLAMMAEESILRHIEGEADEAENIEAITAA